MKLQVDMSAPLGRGYFGAVYPGVDPVQGNVAVKFFERKAAEPDLVWQKRRADLLREGRSLSSARHANVVSVFSISETDDSKGIRLVLEFCTGGSLEKAIDPAPLTLTRARSIATDVVMGLHALHARGMIHRDIKPANILLDANGRAKLGDFGLVTDDIVLGYAGQAGYMNHVAKEIHDGSAGTSVRSDVWAFGMTLYRVIHGQAFYKEQFPPQLEIPKGGYATKPPWLPHVLDGWRRLIRKAMNDDRDKRHQSCDQLLNAIAALPVSDWTCDVQTAKITWTTQRGDRRIEVVQNRATKAWEARTVPVAAGQARRLKAGADVSTLEHFFERFSA